MDDPRIAMKDALKEAMKNKDSERRDVIRLLTSAFKQIEIDTRKELTPEEATAVLQKEAKKRRDSIEEMVGAGREELAEKERYELAIIEEFLPQQLDYDEIKVIAEDVIESVGAEGPKDMGKVMGPLMGKVKGRADGKLVNQVVRDLLNG